MGEIKNNNKNDTNNVYRRWGGVGWGRLKTTTKMTQTVYRRWGGVGWGGGD